MTLVDTGEETMTGGRLKRVADYVKDEEAFCFTYGDGVGDVNITELIAFHKAQKVKRHPDRNVRHPAASVRWISTGDKVHSFKEKPKGDGAMINGGFFVLSPKVIDYIEGDKTIWERDPLERLADEGNLAAFHHHGFWQPMDTLRDKNHLEELWQSGKAPWKVWK